MTEKQYFAAVGRGAKCAGAVSDGPNEYETRIAGGQWIKTFANSAEEARVAHEVIAKAFGQSLDGETVVCEDASR